jgi:hypothetical protein
MAKEMTFEMFKEFVGGLTDEQKSEIRTLLGVTIPVKGTVSKTRSTGKFVRTDKVYENNLNKQMSILIKSLTPDLGLSVEDWAKQAVENKLETQQDPIRIVQYYKKNLMEMGFVKIAE